MRLLASNHRNADTNFGSSRIQAVAVAATITPISSMFPLSSPERVITLLELQSRFGDTPVKFYVSYPQNGAAVLKDLSGEAQTKKKRAGATSLPRNTCAWSYNTHNLARTYSARCQGTKAKRQQQWFESNEGVLPSARRAKIRPTPPLPSSRVARKRHSILKRLRDNREPRCYYGGP